MQIQFDPRDRNACASVLAAIYALHGELPQIGDGPAFGSSAAEAADEQPDPAEAFAGAAAPDEAFPPVPAAPFAEPATLAPTPPAGTPVAGTSEPDNGQPAAPIASPSSAAPAGVELDAKGLPWDARIHAGKPNKKIKVADGSWRKRRGVDDATVAAVEAELRQVMAAPGPANAGNPAPAAPAAASPEPAPAPAPTAAPAAQPPTPEPAAMAPGPDVATPAASAVPAPPVAAVPLAPAPDAATPPVTAAPSPAAPAPAIPAATGDALTLPVLMRKITALQSAGQLTVQGTNEIAVSLGLTSVRDLVQRPDLIASFDALLPEQAQ